MIVVTTEQIEGKRIMETLGLVRGSTIRARHVGHDVMASLRNIVGGEVSGARVESAGDHRCAMSFAVLGLSASACVEIESAEYIATSYPGFVADMVQLGANIKSGGSG